MYSFLINTLFSNEMTASDLLFGSFTKNIKDVAIPGPHNLFPTLISCCYGRFQHSSASQRVLQCPIGWVHGESSRYLRFL